MNVAAAKIGHNRSPYDLSKERIEELFSEARNWCDGEPIANQGQADEVQKLVRLIQEAAKEADERRKEEAKPFDDGKAEVQARYNPLIQKDRGIADLAVAACKKVVGPWLQKIDDENRRKTEAARLEAEEKQRAAMAAMRARDGTNLEENERAEALVREAKEAEAAARRAGNAKATAKGEGRAMTLRDYYTPEITDYTAFARHVWVVHRSDMEEFLGAMAAKIVASGTRSGVPGITVHHERKPV